MAPQGDPMINRLSSFTTIIQRLVTAAIAVAVLMPVTSLAQESGAVLEEILVTATRRAEGTDIQVTPVAVTAIGEKDFNELFGQDIAATARLVPNFSAAQITGFNAAGFAIRAASQTDILVYWEPPVGMLVDDFVVPHMQTQLLEPYDIEQVEVLRGPQGTLFGKNTTAGVISVRTKRPNFDGVAFDASARAGNFGRVEGRVALNVPLVDDKLAFRVAAISQQSDGYYRNGKNSTGVGGFAPPFAYGDYVGDGRKLGGDDVIGGRAKLLWTPTDDLSLLFQYELLRDNSDTPPAVNETDPNAPQFFNFVGLLGVTPGQSSSLDQAGVTFYDTINEGPNAGQSTGLNLAGGHQIDIDGFYLNIDWQIGDFNLVSVTGLREQESRLPSTYTGEVGNLNLNSIFDATRDDDRETFQQEVRLASAFDGPFNFVTGVFYQTDDTDFQVLQYLGIVEQFGTASPDVVDDNSPVIIPNNQKMESTGVFFDANYRFADTWEIAGGIRYTQEEKDFFARPSLPIVSYGETPGSYWFDANDTGTYPCSATIPCETPSADWDEPTYRLMVSNQFSDDAYGYVSFSHGFKSGGYSDQTGSAPLTDPLGNLLPASARQYDPEEADSFEVGLKVDFLDGRARLNTAVFFVDYTDMQRAAIVTQGILQETIVFNAADVPAYGLELEGSFLFSENWTGRFNLGYIDAEYDDFTLDLDLDGTPDLDLSGRDVTRTPEFQVGADLTYDTQLRTGGSLRAQASIYYQDENTNYYAAEPLLPDGGRQFDTKIDSYTLFDAFATYTHSSEKWYVSIFGKNLTDEIYHSASQYVGGLWTFSTYAPPRTYGIEFGVSL
jgi:iron complex outermembrane receptor protein